MEPVVPYENDVCWHCTCDAQSRDTGCLRDELRQKLKPKAMELYGFEYDELSQALFDEGNERK